MRSDREYGGIREPQRARKQQRGAFCECPHAVVLLMGGGGGGGAASALCDNNNTTAASRNEEEGRGNAG